MIRNWIDISDYSCFFFVSFRFIRANRFCSFVVNWPDQKANLNLKRFYFIQFAKWRFQWIECTVYTNQSIDKNQTLLTQGKTNGRLMYVRWHANREGRWWIESRQCRAYEFPIQLIVAGRFTDYYYYTTNICSMRIILFCDRKFDQWTLSIHCLWAL